MGHMLADVPDVRGKTGTTNNGVKRAVSSRSSGWA